MRRRTRLRPPALALLAMMGVNAVICMFVLHVFLAVFGVTEILPEFAAHHSWAADASRWKLAASLVPAAAVSFGLLWFWLIITGRSSRGISWGGAAIYGMFIGLYDVPAACFIEGIRHGFPLLGLLLGLVMVFMVPALMMSMIAFGVSMGLLNGRMAAGWIDRFYPKSA